MTLSFTAPRRFIPTLTSPRGLDAGGASRGLGGGGIGQARQALSEAQQLLDLREPTFLYLTEIVHRQPRQWVGEVDRLHEILPSHGPEVLRRAMEEGLKEEVFSASYVERFLQRSPPSLWKWEIARPCFWHDFQAREEARQGLPAGRPLCSQLDCNECLALRSQPGDDAT
jgi:hypothetical protein